MRNSYLTKKKFSPKLLVLPIALAGAIFGSNTAMASENPVDVIYSQDSLTLQFNQEGDYYEVYKDGEILYKGENNSFIDTDNDIGQNYNVGIYKNNQLEDVIVVKTNKSEVTSNRQVPEENQERTQVDILKDQVNNGYLEAISTSNSVSLKWSELQDSDGIYEIYRDEKKIGETKELEFIDTKVKGEQRYRYEVLAKVEVDDAKKVQIDKELTERNLTPTISQKEELYNSRGILTKIIDTPTKSEQSLKTKPSFFEKTSPKATNIKETSTTVSAAAFPVSEEYSFSYVTFIPQVSTMDPFSMYYLAGDNRGYDPYSSKFRTKSSVNVGFWMPYMSHFPETGLSHKCYTSACTAPYAWTEQASTDGIQIHKDLVTTTKMQWRVNHDVGIPFGSYYPNINYYYNATLTKSSLTVSGSHDKAPAHEFYMFPATSSSYITIERWWVDSGWDFGMLMPGAPQDYFNFSM